MRLLGLAQGHVQTISRVLGALLAYQLYRTLTYIPIDESTLQGAGVVMINQFEPLAIDTLSCHRIHQLPVQWCMDDNGTPRYIGNVKLDALSNNNIRRYNYQGFEKCLANKTIVFVGDSRVRYQFMSLDVGFLKKKSFMKCSDYASLPSSNSSFTSDDDCYLIDYEHHKVMAANDWTSWYVESTKMIGSNVTQQSLCDCF